MLYSIHFDLILPKISAATAKQAFMKIAKESAPRVCSVHNILFSALLENEQKSPSGIGEGIAIPHLKIPGLADRFVCLATLEKPVDFGAADKALADIVCLLLSPAHHGPIHLRGLSRITRLLQNQSLQKALRENNDAELMRAFLLNPDGWLAVA